MVSLPLATRELVGTLKSDNFDIYKPLMFIVLIPVVLLIQDLLRQHSEMSISQV